MKRTVLYATDLHGRQERYRDLLGLAGDLRPDLTVLGGDALPDGDLTDPLAGQVRFANTTFAEFLAALRTVTGSIACCLGNHDWLCTAKAMQALEKQGLMHLVGPERPITLAGLTLIGYWCSPPCPHPVKDFERFDFRGQTFEFGDGLVWNEAAQRPQPVKPAELLANLPTIADELAAICVPDCDDWIFVCHAPPARTGLDILTGMKHVGSQAVRDFLLRARPILSLHGHIHESPRLSGAFWQQIGRTIALNPGQRDEGLAAALIEIDEDGFVFRGIGVECPSAAEPVRLSRATTLQDES